MITWRIQEQVYGGFDRATLKLLSEYARGKDARVDGTRRLKPGTVLVREYQNERHTVTVTTDGFLWREQTYQSLSAIARAITGMTWNGPRFFGLRVAETEQRLRKRHGRKQDRPREPQRAAHAPLVSILMSGRSQHNEAGSFQKGLPVRDLHPQVDRA